MGLPNVMNTGRSGMMAAKAAIGTTGHNISNANTEGYSRQRVQTEAQVPDAGRFGGSKVGKGTLISRVERVNDEYLEKQLRNSGRDVAHFEEKEMVLKQTEDIFNEMNGDGLNRLMSRFFNEFRKLANEPANEAIRQSVREAAQSMVNDFHRIRKQVVDTREHIDSRLEHYTRAVNALTDEIKELNVRIKAVEIGEGSPNDLLDKRDQALKELATYMDVSMHKDKDGAFVVNAKGVGPLVTGPNAEKFSVFRSPADDQGKPENALDIAASSSAQNRVTHQVQGGKLGALVEARDKTLSTILERLDQLAYSISDSVNQVHEMGFNRNGVQGIRFFKTLHGADRASQYLSLSDEVQAHTDNIATAAVPDAPGDNRIAIAISGLQGMKLMNNGNTTADDFYNSIVADVGVTSERNRMALNQTRDIQNQMAKMREQISGVSLDEETANMLKFQQLFGASAKVIQVADEMLDTVLNIKR